MILYWRSWNVLNSARTDDTWWLVKHLCHQNIAVHLKNGCGETSRTTHPITAPYGNRLKRNCAFIYHLANIVVLADKPAPLSREMKTAVPTLAPTVTASFVQRSDAPALWHRKDIKWRDTLKHWCIEIGRTLQSPKDILHEGVPKQTKTPFMTRWIPATTATQRLPERCQFGKSLPTGLGFHALGTKTRGRLGGGFLIISLGYLGWFPYVFPCFPYVFPVLLYLWVGILKPGLVMNDLTHHDPPNGFVGLPR